MAANIGNPLGAVQLTDEAGAGIISAIARATISGGVFCIGSTANNVVGSGASTFVTSDLKVVGNASGAAVNGMALFTQTSGNAIALVTKGMFLLLAAGTVTAGHAVGVDGVNGVHNTGSFALDAQGATVDRSIGRALTGATSGNFCVVNLNI